MEISEVKHKGTIKTSHARLIKHIIGGYTQTNKGILIWLQYVKTRLYDVYTTTQETVEIIFRALQLDRVMTTTRETS